MLGASLAPSRLLRRAPPPHRTVTLRVSSPAARGSPPGVRRSGSLVAPRCALPSADAGDETETETLLEPGVRAVEASLAPLRRVLVGVDSTLSGSLPVPLTSDSDAAAARFFARIGASYVSSSAGARDGAVAVGGDGAAAAREAGRLERERALAALEVTLAGVEEGLTKKERALVELRRQVDGEGGWANEGDAGSSDLPAQVQALQAALSEARAATQQALEARDAAAAQLQEALAAGGRSGGAQGEGPLRAALRDSAQELLLLRRYLTESQEGEEALRRELAKVQQQQAGLGGRAGDQDTQLQQAAEARATAEARAAAAEAAQAQAQQALASAQQAQAQLQLQLSAAEGAQRQREAELAQAAQSASASRVTASDGQEALQQLRAQLEARERELALALAAASAASAARDAHTPAPPPTAQLAALRGALGSAQAALGVRDVALADAAQRFGAAKQAHLRLLAELEARLRGLQREAGLGESRCVSLALQLSQLRALLDTRQLSLAQALAQLEAARGEGERLRALLDEARQERTRDQAAAGEEEEARRAELAALRLALERMRADAQQLAALRAQTEALRGELAQAQAAAAAAADGRDAQDALLGQLDQAQDEAAALRARLAAALSAAERSAADAAAVRADLQAAMQQQGQAGEQLARAHAQLLDERTAGATADADWLGEASRLRAQLAEAQAQAAETARRATSALAAAAQYMGGDGSTSVTFRVKCDTPFGLNVRLMGNVQQLGAWDVKRSIPMRFIGDGMWTAQVVLPAGRVFEYKYLLCGQGGELKRWQPGADSVLTIFRDEPAIEVADDWSCDPTLSFVKCGDGRVEGRQTRLFTLLQQMASTFEALSTNV